MKIPVLFCQVDSIYKKLSCDVYDKDRNALNYDKSLASIYHPPCRLWSRMRTFSTADENEKYLAVWAVRKVQQNGGILEHPAQSTLFKCMQLPRPGETDQYGFTIELDQYHFGHKAQKRTWLYIVGIEKDHFLLNYRKIPGQPKYVCATSSKKGKKELSSKQRSATPIRFAKYLIRIVEHIENVKNDVNFNNLKTA